MALSEATTRSQTVTKLKPPPRAIPPTAATIGFLQEYIFFKYFIIDSRNSSPSSLGKLDISFISMPAENTYSPPVRIILLTSVATSSSEKTRYNS
ncbi:MAG: hypothetical protein BWY90_01005 [Deltaproteobacteria bacterium ADurb.BinA014]|nr:MAG: hypothetical protein BWY90_01005 [Deltaproteobacteria bacterium ADurb.BinA014]